MHVMIDLETLSTRPDAAIISLGAVAFNPEEGVLQDHTLRFYRAITLLSNEQFKRHFSASTILWWMKQSNEARKVFDDPDVMTLDLALGQFSSFVERVRGVEVWGNGADFDNVILGGAYESCLMRRPWSYNKNRCFRTVMADAREADRERLWKKYNVGVSHNALDDAVRQARILCEYKHGVTSEV